MYVSDVYIYLFQSSNLLDLVKSELTFKPYNCKFFNFFEHLLSHLIVSFKCFLRILLLLQFIIKLASFEPDAEHHANSGLENEKKKKTEIVF